MHFILFNGPPRSGKDTAARFAYDYILNRLEYRANWEKFSFPNKRAFAAMVNAPIDEWGHVTPFEEMKDEALPFLGASYRQWQIDFSERFMKPTYGEDIFGRLLIHRARAKSQNPFLTYHVVSDCGFQIECNTLAEFPVLLVTMERPGCSFEGDSREYVSPVLDWKHTTIYNRGSLDGLRESVEKVVGEFLK